MSTARPNYAEIAKKHRGSVHAVIPAQQTDTSEHFPPELSRLVGSVDPNIVTGKPYDGPYGKAIASVPAHDPHRVEINDPARYAQDPTQIKGHEVMHLIQNQLSGPQEKAIPPDDPNHPYDLGNLDTLRKQGKTLLNLPREQQATVIQRWIAVPADRQKLQPWIDDLGKTQLSIMEPTDPSSKTINRAVRPPLPPLDAYKGQPEQPLQHMAGLPMEHLMKLRAEIENMKPLKKIQQ